MRSHVLGLNGNSVIFLLYYVYKQFLFHFLKSKCISCTPLAGVGFAVRVTGLESQDPELEPLSAVELTPAGLDSACHPSEVGEMSAGVSVIAARH